MGRPRKPGKRYPCGALKPSARERPYESLSPAIIERTRAHVAAVMSDPRWATQIVKANR